MSTEDISYLDIELQEGYTNFPRSVLSSDSLETLRPLTSSWPFPIPEDVEVIDVESNGVAGNIYKPKNAKVDVPCLVWLHAGGYVIGGPGYHTDVYVMFVEALGISIFAPKYRLAPEAPYPAALEDGMRAWNFIVDGQAKKYGVSPPSEKIGLGGSSAGAGLAVSIALKLRDSKRNLPCGLVLDAAWLDIPPAKDTPSKTAPTGTTRAGL